MTQLRSCMATAREKSRQWSYIVEVCHGDYR